MADSLRELRAVEFYCGVGGLHLGLQRARPSSRVVAAYDVNVVGNDVYEHNFGLRPSGRDIRALTAAELDAHRADLWLLSPPCQPYTRQGLQLGKADGRAGSFACLLAALQRMEHPPQRLLVENVVGFETSETRGDLLTALSGYLTHEVVLSPSQFGRPYSRPRYFLLAARAPAPRCALSTPLPATPWRVPLASAGAPPASPLRAFLETDAAVWESYAVPWAAVRSSLLAVDLVVEESDGGGQEPANCFTKSYGKYAKGTGSLLARSSADVRLLFEAVERAAAAAEPAGGLEAAGALGKCIASRLDGWPADAPPLRYLTPLEVARLHGFPASFTFPEHVTRLQRYALLGNSLSVDVVAHLLEHLLGDL